MRHHGLLSLVVSHCLAGLLAFSAFGQTPAPPRLESPAASPGGVALQWSGVGVDGFAYRIQSREDLAESLWLPAGPFPNPTDSTGHRTGLDTPFAPERSLNTARPARGVDSMEIRWETVRTPADGYVNLTGRFEPVEHVVAYAVTHIRSPRAMRTTLLLGSDDGVKVFLNGKEILRNLIVRGAEPDQERIPLDLGAGMNVLLLKIENNLGAFGFYARILDKEGVLRMSAAR